MPWDAAIWAGSTAFSAKLATACTVAAMLLLAIDPRRSAIIWRTLLNLGAVCAGVWTVLNCDEVAQWIWTGLVTMTIMSLLASVSQWMTVAPTELHREASQEDKTAVKKSKNAAVGPVGKVPLFWLPSTTIEWLQVVTGKLMVLFAAWSIYTAASGLPLTRWTCVLHAVTTIVFLAASLATAIELTFISSPSGSTLANWKQLSLIAIVAWLGELACVSQVLFWFDDSNRDFNNSILVLVFAITVVVINFIVWMIPHRLTQFANKGTTSDWVSLTIASWTVTLCLVLVILLPFNWPWTL